MGENRELGVLIDPGLSERLRVGGLLQAGIRVTAERGEELARVIHETEVEMRSLYGASKPSEIPGLQPARKLFRSIGVDPTRMRPASEALLRRVLKGQGFPAINNVVDAANLVSFRHLIPVGLYDRDRIHGEVLLRLGKVGETYQRIGSGTLNLSGRIGLFDREGGFGNPTGDSQRTSIQEDTKNLLFVVFFPLDHDRKDILQMIHEACETLTRYAGGWSKPLGEDGLITFEMKE